MGGSSDTRHSVAACGALVLGPKNKSAKRPRSVRCLPSRAGLVGAADDVVGSRALHFALLLLYYCFTTDFTTAVLGCRS
jgi:hypothetical protein